MMKIEDFMVGRKILVVFFFNFLICQGDFCDGVQFCNLLEVISGKKLPKWNAKPRIKAQKLENVSFGLQFLKKEGIKLVAIGPEDVVEPKLKLILGLIWTIILRYQIQRGEDDGGEFCI
jgi:filamin